MKKDRSEPVHSERFQKIIEQFKTSRIDGQKIRDHEFSEYFIKTQLEHLTIEELGSFQKILNKEKKVARFVVLNQPQNQLIQQ